MTNLADSASIGSPQLTVDEPGGTFTVALTGDSVSFGRDPSCDIHVRVPFVSRRHARLERVDGAYKYIQTGGTNPTFVEGRPVMERILEDGDTLSIGPEEGPTVTLVIAYPGARPAVAGSASQPPGAIVEAPGEDTINRTLQPKPQLIVNEPQRSFRVTLEGDSLSFGREPDSDIRVNAPFVSRRHGAFERLGDTYKYIQISKTNPTRVAAGPVMERVLQHGDTLSIGRKDGPVVTLAFDNAGSPAIRAEGDDLAQASRTSGPVLLRASLAGRDALSIGRDPGNDLVLPSEHVSWRHAVIRRRDGRHLMQDLHSTNGTFANGNMIDLHELKEGDSIRIGPYRLSFADEEIQGYNEQRAVRLDVDRVMKRIGELEILTGVSLSVFPGELLAIAGTSGSGKSTLMDALNGVRPATSGQVRVNGVDAYRNFDAIKPLVGYVPQFSTLHEQLPLERALYYVGRLRFPGDVTDEEVWRRVREVLGTLQIEDRRGVPVGRLSGGQQKRASIAAELLTEPGLFFLDEPTTGLDAGLTRKLMVVIRRLADDGRTVILVTHDTESLDLCDLMIFLASGRTVYLGPPREAKSYFGVMGIADVYSRIEEEDPPAVWEDAYLKSGLHDKYVRRRQLGVLEPGSSQEPTSSDTIPPPKTGLSGWRQWQVLVRRYVELTIRDRLTLALVLIQAPILALLLVLIALPNGLTHLPGIDIPLNELETVLGGGEIPPELSGIAIPVLPLLMAASVTWLGSMNASREIVKEVAIFRRERVAGLKILPYVLSKVAVLGALCIIQTTVFFGIVIMRVDVPSTGVFMSGYAEIYLTLLLTCFASMGLGLLISALSPNPDRAQGLVPLALIPQLLLARVGPDAPPIAHILAYSSIPRWALHAIGSTVGLPGDDFDHTVGHILGLWIGLGAIAIALILVTGGLLARRRLA